MRNFRPFSHSMHVPKRERGQARAQTENRYSFRYLAFFQVQLILQNTKSILIDLVTLAHCD